MPADPMQPLYAYASALLTGVCREPFQLGNVVSSSGDIFLKARLDPKDYDDLAYGDVYGGIRSVLWRWGALQAPALAVRFNFVDPRNDAVEFQAPVVPLPASRGIAATKPAPSRARTARRRARG